MGLGWGGGGRLGREDFWGGGGGTSEFVTSASSSLFKMKNGILMCRCDGQQRQLLTVGS